MVFDLFFLLRDSENDLLTCVDLRANLISITSERKCNARPKPKELASADKFSTCVYLRVRLAMA